jgi:hypothetical protein
MVVIEAAENMLNFPRDCEKAAQTLDKARRSRNQLANRSVKRSGDEGIALA